MALLHRQTGTPNDRPDASSRLSGSFNGHHHRSRMRTSLKVTGPLLVAGACTAVAMAAGNSNGATSTNNAQLKTTLPNASSQVTVNQGSSQAASTATTSQTNPNGPVTHSYSVTNQGDTSARVTVNGQQVTVPPNGTVQQSYTSPDGSSSLSVSASVDGSGSVTSSSNFSTNVNISTKSGTDSTFSSNEDSMD